MIAKHSMILLNQMARLGWDAQLSEQIPDQVGSAEGDTGVSIPGLFSAETPRLVDREARS